MLKIGDSWKLNVVGFKAMYTLYITIFNQVYSHTQCTLQFVIVKLQLVLMSCLIILLISVLHRAHTGTILAICRSADLKKTNKRGLISVCYIRVDI